jgi:protoheme IX farnesyltransferase
MQLTTATERAGLAAFPAQERVRQRLRDYATLTKPHIISLLLVTTVMPMVLAARGWPGGRLVLWTVLGGYLMAGSANATNMFIDRDIDGRMSRTRLRPIPSGRMSPGHALGFAVVLLMAGMHVLAAWVNHLAAALALAGWVWYVGIYTVMLKRTSPHACVIGGVAGAIPPLVGWAAVTGALGVLPVVFFLIVFLWTPPHFWALSLVKQKDYGAVGVPMAPNVWGERATKRQMLVYTLALVPVTLIPVALGALGWVYAAAALSLGAWFLASVARVALREVPPAVIWKAYRGSLLYLALLFAAMAVDVTLLR